MVCDKNCKPASLRRGYKVHFASIYSDPTIPTLPKAESLKGDLAAAQRYLERALDIAEQPISSPNTRGLPIFTAGAPASRVKLPRGVR